MKKAEKIVFFIRKKQPPFSKGNYDLDYNGNVRLPHHVGLGVNVETRAEARRQKGAQDTEDDDYDESQSKSINFNENYTNAVDDDDSNSCYMGDLESMLALANFSGICHGQKKHNFDAGTKNSTKSSDSLDYMKLNEFLGGISDIFRNFFAIPLTMCKTAKFMTSASGSGNFKKKSRSQRIKAVTVRRNYIPQKSSDWQHELKGDMRYFSFCPFSRFSGICSQRFLEDMYFIDFTNSDLRDNSTHFVDNNDTWKRLMAVGWGVPVKKLRIKILKKWTFRKRVDIFFC